MWDLGRPKVIDVGDTSHQDDFFGGVLMLKRYLPAFTIPFVAAATFAAWGFLPGTAFAESPPILSHEGGNSIIVFQNSARTTVRYTFVRSGGPITRCDSSPAMDQSSDFYRSTGLVLNFNHVSRDCQILYFARGPVRAPTLFEVTATGPGGQSSPIVVSVEVKEGPRDSPNVYLHLNRTLKTQPSFPDMSDMQFSPGDFVDILVPLDGITTYSVIETCTLGTFTSSPLTGTGSSGNIANLSAQSYSNGSSGHSVRGCRILGQVPVGFQGSLSFSLSGNIRTNDTSLSVSTVNRSIQSVAGLVRTFRSLNVSHSSGGIISAAACPATGCPALINVENGTSVTLTAIARNGFVFMGWVGCSGGEAGNLNSCLAELYQDLTVRAIFAPRVFETVVSGSCDASIGVTSLIGPACFKNAQPSSTNAVTDVLPVANASKCVGAQKKFVAGVNLCVTYAPLPPGDQSRASFVTEVFAGGTCKAGFVNKGKTKNGNLLCLKRPSP